MTKYLYLAFGLALLAPVKAHALFAIPTADVDSLKADFIVAGGVIMGLAVLFMSYRFIKRLIK